MISGGCSCRFTFGIMIQWILSSIISSHADRYDQTQSLAAASFTNSKFGGNANMQIDTPNVLNPQINFQFQQEWFWVRFTVSLPLPISVECWSQGTVWLLGDGSSWSGGLEMEMALFSQFRQECCDLGIRFLNTSGYQKNLPKVIRKNTTNPGRRLQALPASSHEPLCQHRQRQGEPATGLAEPLVLGTRGQLPRRLRSRSWSTISMWGDLGDGVGTSLLCITTLV